jgi:4-amino-4-deoxy-L-arabinose transferase-like glycosyltransferase
MGIVKQFSLFTLKSNLFWLLFGVALILRLVLVWVLPFGQTVKYGLEGLNDEPSHYNYVKYLAENRQFPVQTESSKSPAAFEHNVYEYYQAPFYYVINAFLVTITGLRNALYAGRMISWFFGVLTLLVLGNILHLICPDKKVIASGVLVCAFLPAHVYFCSLVSNDSISWFAGTWLLYLLMSCDKVPDKKNGIYSIHISLVLAFAMIIKSSSFIYYPVVAYSFFYNFRKKGEIKLLWWAIASIFISLILVFPWYWRNLQLYGSCFAIDIGFGPPGSYLRSFKEIAHFGASTARFFWFPMQHVPKDGILVNILNVLGPILILLYAGLAIMDALIRVWKKKLNFKEQILWITLVLTVIAYIRLNMSWANPEGRYLYTALGSVIAMISASPVRLLSNRGVIFHLAPAVAAVLYGYFYFLVI